MAPLHQITGRFEIDSDDAERNETMLEKTRQTCIITVSSAPRDLLDCSLNSNAINANFPMQALPLAQLHTEVKDRLCTKGQCDTYYGGCPKTLPGLCTPFLATMTQVCAPPKPGWCTCAPAIAHTMYLETQNLCSFLQPLLPSPLSSYHKAGLHPFPA